MVNEFRKIFNIRLFIMILLIIAGFEAGYAISIYGVKNSDDIALKEQLYSEYGGRITDASAKRLEEYNNYVNNIIASESDMEEKYNQGIIGADEYMEYRGLSRSSTYREFLSRDDYAQTLYEFYMSIDPEEYIGTDFRKQAADMRFNSKSFVKISGIQFIEVTMATDEFYESLTKAGRQNIIKKSQEISRYIADNDVCNTCATMWSCYSKSGYNAFEATVKKYDVTPKWKSFMEE